MALVGEAGVGPDLHAPAVELQLVLAMYTVAFAALVVTGARLGDVLSRRRAFLLGLAGFTVASLAGGLAPSPAALVAARTAQGVAGALMTPQVLSILQAEFDGERRVRAIGAYSLILAVAVAPSQQGNLSGLLLTANLVGSVLGVAGLTGVFLGALDRGSAHALAVTTAVLAALLVVTAGFAARASTTTGSARGVARW